MKPTKLLFALLTIFLLNACSEDDPAVDSDDKIPTEFSDLTPEEHKTKLEDNGLLLVSDVKELKNSPGIKTSTAFSHFLTYELPETSARKASSVQPLALIRSLAQFGKGKSSASEVLSGMRKKESDPETAQELFDSVEGTFSFNAATEEWTYTAADNGKITFLFPSTEAGTENNAKFEIYGYESVQVNNPEVEYDGDLPTALKADLTVDGSKQIEFVYSASYKSNGEPTSVENTLTIGAFKFATTAVNNTSEVSVEYALTKGDKNLISIGASANGNFASSNIEQNDEEVGKILEKGSAYLQIMNIRFAGQADVKAIDNALAGDEVTAQQEADAFNNHATFVVFYADTEEKIADTEFYVLTETDEYCYWEDLNGDGTSEEECYSYEDEYIDIRLIFADNSKADLETYTDVGFDEITTELEDLMDEIESDLE